MVNSFLVKLAEASLKKQGFVPSQQVAGGAPPADPMAGGMPPMDPMAGGMPPMDPMAGGMPPMPPMDPMAGGMPPMDPVAGGGGGGDIRTIIREELAEATGGGAGKKGKGSGGTSKPDLALMARDLYQLKTMLVRLFEESGKPLPPEILDDQPRDPGTGMPVEQEVEPAGEAKGPEPKSAIPPIEPMQAAFPMPQG